MRRTRLLLIVPVLAAALAGCGPATHTAAAHPAAGATHSAAVAPTAVPDPAGVAAGTVGAPGGGPAVAAGHGWHGITLDGPTPPPGSCHQRTAANGSPLPDPTCTPGSVDPAVTADGPRYLNTICRTGGYTGTVRPPASVTDRYKRLSEKAYGLTTTEASEYDHLVSLELGGSSDQRNLWPQPGTVPNPKDKVEGNLHDAVCAGLVPLAQAQQMIARDWTTVPTYVIPKKH